MSANVLSRTTRSIGQGFETARLRAAELSDLPKLVTLYARARPQAPESEESMAPWLEQGGALVLEDFSGRLLSALRWRETEQGWWLDQPATLPGRAQEFARWLMTKLEALAIQRNIPLLYVHLDTDDEALLHYYQRLGYTPLGEGCPPILGKHVGGMWQVKR